MTSEELRTTLKRLNLTQGEAADLLGVGLRSVNAWANGDRSIPEPAARLLRTWLRRPDVFPRSAASELDLSDIVSEGQREVAR